MGKRWTERQKEFVKNNCLKMTYQEIGIKIGRSTGSVGTWCCSNGLSQKSSIHIVHEQYFDKWSAEMAYILGFIVADGSISRSGYRLEISIQLKDRFLLEKIRDILIPSFLLEKRIIKVKNKKYFAVRLTICRKYLVRRLMALGIKPAKSKDFYFNPVLIQNCPKKYRGDLLRGFLDGDGCVRIKKGTSLGNFTVCSSSRPFLKNVQTTLGFGYGNIYKVRDSNCWEWLVGKREHLQNLYKTIYYKNDLIYLERKKNKFIPIMEASLEKCYPSQKWSKKEVKLIYKSYREFTNKQLSKKLNRPIGSVIAKKHKLGLTKEK